MATLRYPVINDVLQIVGKLEGRFQCRKLNVEVFAQQRQVKQMERRLFGSRDAFFVLLPSEFHLTIKQKS